MILNWRHLTFFTLLLVLGICILDTSCVKESKCDCMADTIKIAKIYQPEGLNGKDAVIESLYPDSCFGSAPLLTVFSWTNGGVFNAARTLIRFDISDIPMQTSIKAATLTMYWNSYENLTEHTGDNTFSIYRIIQDWNENTINWNNQPSTSDMHVVSVPKSRLKNQNYTDIDVTSLIQDIVDNPTVNYGFMLKLDEELPFKLVILASSDYTGSKRPKLVVYY